MSGSQKISKIISQLNKKSLVNNTTVALTYATEKAQEAINNIQHVASQKYGNIVKNVNGSTIIQNLQASALEPSPPLPQKLVNWWQWYQKLVGLDTVEQAKQGVIEIQNTLFKCQETRRELSRLANNNTDKLKEIYSELLHIRRDDPKYVQLTMQENKNLQEHGKLMKQLSALELEERDYFTQLATAIKEYHDAQNLNAQKYKYLSILASVSIAMFSLIGTMIYNSKRVSTMNQSIAEAQIKNESIFKSYFENLDKKLVIQINKISEQIEQTNLNMNWVNKNPAMKKYVQHVMNTPEEETPTMDVEKFINYGFYATLGIVAVFILSRIN